MIRVLVCLAALVGVPVAQSTLVLPAGFEGVEAGGSTRDPFDRGQRASRAQYGYDRTLFSGIGGPIEIYRMRIRANGGAFSLGGRFARCVVRIGSCDDHATLGQSFDGNWSGAQPAPSYDGPVRVAGADRSAPGLWYVDIGLRTPARYDRTSGRDLLVEIAVDARGLVGSSAASDAVSGLSGVTQVAKSGNGTLPDGDVSAGTGLVLELFYRPLSRVVPHNATSVGGSTTTETPFGSASGPFRVQYCFDSSRFTDAGVDYPIAISELRIVGARTAPRSRGGTLAACDVRIGAAAVDHLALSTTFDWNWIDGAVPLAAYAGSVTVPDSPGSPRGLPTFSVVSIPLSRPIVYDPGSGSDLLVEFSAQGAWRQSLVPTFDMAAVDVNPQASQLLSRASSDAVTGTLNRRLGLVADIRFAPASDPLNDGFLLGQGLAYVVGPGTSDGSGAPLDPRAIRRKKAGFDPGRESRDLPRARPDFRWSSILAGATGLEIDAFSLGLDRLWANDSGRISPSCERGTWNVLAFTVSPETGGANGRVHAEQALGDGVIGDVFGYALESSAGEIPARFRGRTLKLLNGTDLDISGGGPDAGLAAVDGFMPAYGLGDAIAGLLSAEPVLWFSVTDGSKGSLPVSWLGGDTSARSGATIFRTTWTRDVRGGGAWSAPVVDLAPRHLGLVSADDIDALAIDVRPSDTCASSDARHYLFSLTSDSTTVPASELLFVSRGSGMPFGPVTPVAYTDADGRPIADKIGGGDRVRSICLEDPGPPQLAGGIPSTPEQIFLAVWGVPRDLSHWHGGGDPLNLFGTLPPSRFKSSPELNLSLLRGCDAGRNPTLEPWMVGWPGGERSASSVVFKFLLDVSALQLVELGEVLMTRPGGPFGDPSSQAFSLPANSALIGVELFGVGLVLTDTANLTFSNVSSLWL